MVLIVKIWYVNGMKKNTIKKVHEVGIVEHPTHDFLGASPDGVCESGRLVEIKMSEW